MAEFEVTELRAFSDQATLGVTPIAFTEFDKVVLEAELGSRDIPLVLNSSPSIYASADSGGAGDARVNVRGFSQRNISIMVNGVPINDLENGWVYWSNWDGLGGVSRTIQVQRGLSYATLPTPAIGGTMNVITDPASARRGASVRLETGSGDFYKFTGVVNTGIVNDRFAVTAGAVVKEGDGNFDGGWTKGRGYYIGASWDINDRNRLEFYAFGAPQQHGQRFDANIAVWDADYARKLGYSEADVQAAIASGPVDAGVDFNSNYSPVSESYSGLQYYWGDTHRREKRGFLNETVNYFHKPQINLNWYSTLSENLNLGTVVYYSGGRGGGSGTYGSVLRYGNTHPLKGNVDWDATIERNQTTLATDGSGDRVSRGVLRNSVNNQDQYGVISKLNFQVNPDLKMMAGIDWRTATIDHFREVRDLLGGDYYLDSSSDFWAGPTKRYLGDKVNYDNTNTIDWLGLFVQGEYDRGPINAFATYGYSTIEYSFVDHFADDGTGNQLRLDSGSFDGHQIKGGVRYSFNSQLSAYVNAGWVSKVPIFDAAIDDTAGAVIPDAENEKFQSYEAGVRWETADGRFNVSGGVYYTEWRDRTVAAFSRDQNGRELITYARGINSNHAGIEIESAYQPNRWVRFDGALSFGDWYYTDDVRGDAYYIDTQEPIPGFTGALYVKDVKVGDQPQSQAAYAVTFFPVEGLSIKLLGRWYDRHWADFDPVTRSDPNDRGQSWRAPSYTVYDLHVNYALPQPVGPAEVSLFLHVFNLFDKMYISDASDNSSFEGINSAPSHSAQRAAVFLGEEISFNTGVQIRF